jgi:hypothetical protein
MVEVSRMTKAVVTKARSAKSAVEQLAKTYQIAEGRKFLVIGDNVWGAHFNLQTAFKNAQSQTGTLKRVLVYDAQGDAFIDNYGYINYVPEETGEGREPYVQILKYEK